MLTGAAGKLVGMGSGWPWAMALARLYMKLLLVPSASMAAATIAQLRISVVIVKKRMTTPCQHLRSLWGHAVPSAVPQPMARLLAESRPSEGRLRDG